MRGAAQGYSLSQFYFQYLSMKEVEKAEFGIQLGEGGRIGGMLFADDFVGESDSKKMFQKLIDAVYNYCNKWRLKAKSLVIIFAKEAVEGGRA